MITKTFEDDHIKYYVTSDDKIFLHKNHAEKHEEHLRKKQQNQQHYFAATNWSNPPYDTMKQWLKDNQLLVQDMIQEL